MHALRLSFLANWDVFRFAKTFTINFIPLYFLRLDFMQRVRLAGHACGINASSFLPNKIMRSPRGPYFTRARVLVTDQNYEQAVYCFTTDKWIEQFWRWGCKNQIGKVERSKAKISPKKFHMPPGLWKMLSRYQYLYINRKKCKCDAEFFCMTMREVAQPIFSRSHTENFWPRFPPTYSHSFSERKKCSAPARRASSFLLAGALHHRRATWEMYAPAKYVNFNPFANGALPGGRIALTSQLSSVVYEQKTFCALR